MSTEKIIYSDGATGFTKQDAQKISGYALIPKVAVDALADVLQYGANKYEANQWKLAKGNKQNEERVVNALWRHLLAWQNGEMIDSESGKSHLAHAITNVAFLLYFEHEDK